MEMKTSQFLKSDQRLDIYNRDFWAKNDLNLGACVTLSHSRRLCVVPALLEDQLHTKLQLP